MIQAIIANRFEDRILSTTEEMTKGQGERVGWGHCGDDLVNDQHEREVRELSTSNESPLFDQDTPAPILGLRGGAGDDDRNERKSKRLEDDERVPALVWYLAGNKGPQQTVKQLPDLL